MNSTTDKKIKKIEKEMETLDKDSPRYKKLADRRDEKLKKAFATLTPWDRVVLSRHPDRPHAIDYIETLFTDFIELAGDRYFANDEAIIGGIARFYGQSVMVIAQEKGHDIETRQKHRFGMANPEGYRKAIRLMDMADRFGIPVITFVDTDGAYPGKDAEERGQAEAIARSTEKCLNISVPLISIIIGFGGSGGAIGLAAANKIIMLENSVYSVISPEGASAILWKDSEHKEEVANKLKITAADLLKMKIIDRIVKEPLGGAHTNKDETIRRVKKAIMDELFVLLKYSKEKIVKQKLNKYLIMTKEN
ncbi:MAG: acetyl-CoA carboxylase carboxyltransferase subunit alpha [Rickettsiales bacterium]|jgi:acetyl-CoA carboxylase carboxyl transferase subunit alpha|nr:acetyl-CoA carboxylase carboxyltransferase subunit alpha [Rickettsiales bacterium]